MRKWSFRKDATAVVVAAVVAERRTNEKGRK